MLNDVMCHPRKYTLFPIVYTPYVYQKMVVYQSVTPALVNKVFQSNLAHAVCKAKGILVYNTPRGVHKWVFHLC